MKLCEYCLSAIKSHGERIAILETIYTDETDPTESRCEWCEETGNDKLHDIKFK